MTEERNEVAELVRAIQAESAVHDPPTRSEAIIREELAAAVVAERAAIEAYEQAEDARLAAVKQMRRARDESHRLRQELYQTIERDVCGPEGQPVPRECIWP